MLGKIYLLIPFLMLFFITSCSEKLTEVSQESDLQVLLSLRDTKSSQSRMTTHSRIHLLVTNSDGEAVKDTTISSSDALSMVNFDGILIGTVSVTVWTTDDADTIHTPQTKDVTIEMGKSSSVSFILEPRCGSIIAQLIEVPTAVDSVHFSFVSDSGSFFNKQKRATTMSLPLDKVPYGAIGTISLACLRESGDTVTSWDTVFTFLNQNSSMELNLINNGSMEVNIEIKESSISLISGTGDTTAVLGDEINTGIVISEFCATGGSSESKEFIELYNSNSEAVTLTGYKLVVKGIEYIIPEVTLQANDCYVLGSEGSSDVWPSDVEIGLDLSSTSGTIFLFCDDQLVDYVIYFNDFENAGWPKLSSSAKTSWQLKGAITDPEQNNYGTAWCAAVNVQTTIDDEQWYGSPGVMQ